MNIGFVYKEATTEYFYFVVDPKNRYTIGIGSILKVRINNYDYFAIIEDLRSESVEEDRLFDYDAIDVIYGKMQKAQYLIIGKAIFLGVIKDNKMYSEKPIIPPSPGDIIYLPTKEEIYKIYSFDDPRTLIPIGKIYLQNEEFNIDINIKNLIIRHTGIFGITGSGKSTTVAHIVNQLKNKNIPIILFDVHRDYILSYDNAIIITFSQKEKEFLEKLAYERNKNIKVYIGKVRLNLLIDYMEEFLGISGKQASNVFSLLSKLLSKDPKFINKLFDMINRREPSEIFERYKEDTIRSLYSRLLRIKDWQLFPRDINDTGDDIKDLIDKLSENMREGSFNDISIVSEGDEAILMENNRFNPNMLIIDLYPLSIEEQRILLDIILELLYEKYKSWKLNNRTDIIGIIIEEAHRFAAKYTNVSNKISLIAREGRKFGLGLLLISQIPSNISEDIISQINTFILLKIINPKDLEFIRKTCPYLSREYFEALTKLETGSCLTVGLAVKNPAILKIIKSVDVGGTEEDIDKRILERVSYGNKSNI
ncbi:DNA double-strand break repair helicase HerA [Nanobdella aerobiophila]|uniref:DNA double-strand break repair helicase HerA n=1 Tax=Nanobdella aerobiophila TaxID=2586965 RepID=A0A915SK45_9ARCH|nr:ATP-binding protein [Nanobdella aerobiophila]BBL45428.1 DNA double-strand break repair helicase HerA [Nanobdella aerobiophila]